MATKGSPSLDLDLVKGGETATKIVSTVPFEPAPVIGVLLGIGQEGILLCHDGVVVWNPPLCCPLRERETGLDVERIQGRVRVLWGEFALLEGTEEPLFGIF